MENFVETDNSTFDSTCSGNFSLGNIVALFQNYDCLRHSVPFSVVLIILFIFVFVHGIVGNSVVIYVLIRRARLWSETNLLILNLAVSDLTVTTICVPGTLMGCLFKPWILGDFSCKLTAYAQAVSVFVSVYSLVAISIDRYVAVRAQANPTVGFTNMQTKHAILLIWTVALSTTFPWALKFNIVYSEADKLNFCEETWNKQVNEMIYFIFGNLIARLFFPLVTIVFMMIGIGRTIEIYTVPAHWSPAYHELRKRKRVNILKLLTGLSSAFFICWLPFYIVKTIGKMAGIENGNQLSSEIYGIFPFVHLLRFLNSCVNPLLYFYLDENFKISFQSLFGLSPVIIQREPRVNYRRGREEEEGRFEEVVQIEEHEANVVRWQMDYN